MTWHAYGDVRLDAQAFTDARAQFNKCPYDDVPAMRRVLVELQAQLLAAEEATGVVRVHIRPSNLPRLAASACVACDPRG